MNSVLTDLNFVY